MPYDSQCAVCPAPCALIIIATTANGRQRLMLTSITQQLLVRFMDGFLASERKARPSQLTQAQTQSTSRSTAPVVRYSIGVRFSHFRRPSLPAAPQSSSRRRASRPHRPSAPPLRLLRCGGLQRDARAAETRRIAAARNNP